MLQKDFKCSFCNKLFAERAQMLIHERRHHTKELDYHCPVCGKRFPSKSGVNTHNQRAHKNVPCALVKNVGDFNIEIVVMRSDQMNHEL